MPFNFEMLPNGPGGVLWLLQHGMQLSRGLPLGVMQEDFSISDYPNFMVIELGETYDLCRYNQHCLY